MNASAQGMSKLQEFRKESNSIKQNRMLFEWLADDQRRGEFYQELRDEGFPVLKFKSLLRSGNDVDWPNQDVYLVSKKADVEMALQRGSVKPYAELDKGARFMLGLDAGIPHTQQRSLAAQALRFTDQEIADCARVAFRRASILPLKSAEFDLATGLAAQAGNGLAAEVALRFTALLFGFRDEAHPYLQQLMFGAYTQLVFQIVGRHFVSDTGLPPSDSPEVEDALEHLKAEIRTAAEKRIKRPGAPKQTVIERLVDDYGNPGNKELNVVALGLIAGTIGNVCAAVSIAIDDFFAERGDEPPLIDAARQAARTDQAALGELIKGALRRNPPAPFLARTATGEGAGFDLRDGRRDLIPEGAHLLLALGVAQEYELVFGGPEDAGYLHRCIGPHLAWPLILETVQQVLLLPGLSQVIDPVSGKPEKLKKRWGAICDNYPMQFQCARRLNQQPLHLLLPIKEPVAENAENLLRLLQAGAPVVEEALDKRKHVHSAYFMLVEGGTHLSMMTVYDGDFDAYVEHFAIDVPLFDEQLKYLKDAPPLPTSKYPKQFVEWIKQHNLPPLGGYFYSAYPTLTVADIENANEAQSKKKAKP
jgi:cytochrome P450